MLNLKYKNPNHTGERFVTEVGVCQGDCISAILFMFYLSISLTIKQQEEHPYAKSEVDKLSPTLAEIHLMMISTSLSTTHKKKPAEMIPQLTPTMLRITIGSVPKS